jgi:hypothetical protein
MKSPKKNEVVIAWQTCKGLVQEARFLAHESIDCTWEAGNKIPEEAYMLIRKLMRESLRKEQEKRQITHEN